MEDTNNKIVELNKKISDIVNEELMYGMGGIIATDVQIDSSNIDFTKNKFTIKGSFKGLSKK